jgi:hypothetical protein
MFSQSLQYKSDFKGVHPPRNTFLLYKDIATHNYFKR